MACLVLQQDGAGSGIQTTATQPLYFESYCLHLSQNFGRRGMQCPSCQHTVRQPVLESRSADSGRSVRRRRECLQCDFRFTTTSGSKCAVTVKSNATWSGKSQCSKLLNGLNRAW